jgi:Fucose permease
MNQINKLYLKLVPVMLAFFAMGFVDLVGIATNYVKADFTLSDTTANLLPSMVFFWFLIFSVPTGMLMNKIGRKKTVVISLVITTISLLIPVINYSFVSMLISFSLLGIGNAIMQVSLNPLLSNLISGDKLASSLTFGQFVKAIASFIAPIIAGWAAFSFGNWKLLYPIFMLISIIAVVFLGLQK